MKYLTLTFLALFTLASCNETGTPATQNTTVTKPTEMEDGGEQFYENPQEGETETAPSDSIDPGRGRGVHPAKN